MDEQPIEQPQQPPIISTDGPYTERIVGIRFRSIGKVYDFDARDFKFARGDKVVCDHTEKGQMLGFVSKPTITISSEEIKLRLPPVLRPANYNDIRNREKQEIQEKESLVYVREEVSRRNLDMHVIAVEIPLSGKKAIVYYSAEDRIDFRELVKDLVAYFRMRVEMQHLAARDETKFIGSIGPCGQETCCSRFINKFHNVGIKMAKDQGLSLNPTKVSGNCGRLKCCLAYEQPVYAEARKTLPKLGNCVKCKSADGGAEVCGVVSKLDVLKQMITVHFDDGTFETLPATRILEVDTLKKSKAPDAGEEDTQEDPMENEVEDVE